MDIQICFHVAHYRCSGVARWDLETLALRHHRPGRGPGTSGGSRLEHKVNYFYVFVALFCFKGEGGVYKGWNNQLAQRGAIIPTIQRAPGYFEYIYKIIKTNDVCDIISIHVALILIHQLSYK